MKTYDELRHESAGRNSTLIVDMDGTLALKGERKPFDWGTVGEDLPNFPVTFVISRLQLHSTILIVSGRDEECALQTSMWLHSRDIFPHEIFMRKHKDNRPDEVVKREIFLEKIRPHYRNIVGVFDDRQKVVNMWRELDLFVFDVSNGNGNF